MKRIIFFLALFFAGWQLPAQHADSPLVTYIGRTFRDGTGVQADWSGTMAVIRFQGRFLEMEYANSGVTWVNVWVDREPDEKADAIVRLEAEGRLELARFKKAGEHTVYVQKRTEGDQGCITYKSFHTDGSLLQARPWKDRVIEFVGDSYTCGFGTEAPSASSPFIPDEENCNLSYSGILGRFFDADVVRIAHSGRGVARNYNDGDPDQTMTVRYTRTFDTRPSPEYEPEYKPDIVVIYLGTNDFSRGKQPSLRSWTKAYKTLLEQIRTMHGADVPILCVASNIDILLGDYVREVALNCGLEAVCWTAVNQGAHNRDTDLGAAGHPNYRGMRKVAACMAPYIATMTGWDLPAIPLK